VQSRQIVICLLGACVVACSSSHEPERAPARDGGITEAGPTRTDAARDGAASEGHRDASTDGGHDGGPSPDSAFIEPTAVLPALTSAPLTLAQTIVPSHALLNPPDPGPPSTPSVLSKWMSDGYGLTTLGAGEPLLDVAPPGSTVPAPGANPTMLVRFAHLPDIQLADDESPNRLCNFDAPASEVSTDGAFRPQEGDECRILDAAVRTINEVSNSLPLSFVLTGGDNADSAQTNELTWFMQIMDGAKSVKCDSGDISDPVPGPNNDGKDPFDAVGLSVPWWWVTGNHDVLVQGTFVVDTSSETRAIGTEVLGATRDYALPGAPLTMAPVIADPRRALLDRTALMTAVAADANGHGIGSAQVTSGKAFYTFDVPGTPLRFVILDTAAETGGSDGVVHQADITSTLKPMLDQASSDGKLVITASHHSTDQIGDGSDPGGVAQADALTSQEWVDFLGGYDNILFSLVGHVHSHRVTYITPTAGHSFWEVMTGALADYPHQFRLIEIWDDDNGWIRMRAIVTDYDTASDPVAAIGKSLGIADQTSGWAHDGYGTTTDRNIELYIPKP
jgi:hypothetical protein